MGRMADKVVLITGAARGQGRAHALRMAEEGADVIGIDVLSDNQSVAYPLATEEDMSETERLVLAAGGKFLGCQGDVRSQASLDAAVAEGLRAFGHIDVVCVNAGISGEKGPSWERSEESFENVLQVNLYGAWRTVKATVPHMIEAGRGGSIVMVNSTLGLKGGFGMAAYSSSKHGLLGLMRTLTIELAPHGIRVNSVHPTGVGTGMILNASTWKHFRPDLEDPTLEDARAAFEGLHLLSIPWVEPVDVANAVLWLASDEARYITGVALPVDAGNLSRG